MTKQNTIYGICALFVGLISGITATAYALGADKQRVNDMLDRHTAALVIMRSDDTAHEKAIQQELDRFTEIIASPITLLQSSIIKLTADIASLHTDVQVLKALMERMENERNTPD